jgi:hypothetical protein
LSAAAAAVAAAAAAAGELRFGSCDATLGFLPEHLIPKDFKRHIEEVRTSHAAFSMRPFSLLDL